MLIRSTWTLTVAEPTTLPRSFGLELVKELHQLSRLTMGNETIPSVTCFGIVGKANSSGDFITFHSGEFYQLSLCGLQENAAKEIAPLSFTVLTTVYDTLKPRPIIIR